MYVGHKTYILDTVATLNGTGVALAGGHTPTSLEGGGSRKKREGQCGQSSDAREHDWLVVW